MRTILLFLFGLALALPLMAQEPNKKSEALILQTEGEGFSTNRVTVETGIKEDTPVAPTIALEEKPQDESSAPKDERKEAASSTNTAANAKLSFLMDIGNQYVEEEEYKDAERAYLRALEANPDSVAIRFRLSTLYLLMDRYAEAVSILEVLVAEFPDDSEIRNNLAWAYATGEGVRNKEKALRHAREAILLAPISPSAWNTLAEAYYMGGDYERAARASKHAMDLLIQRGPEQTQLPDFQAQLQKIQRAAQALKRLKGLDDED